MPTGDNKEFAIPNVSDGDVTVFFYHATGKTSANDTATKKYFDTDASRTTFAIRTDQVLHIVQINGRVLTDPITVPANGSHIEKESPDRRDTEFVDKLVIKSTQNNTNVKIRTRGGTSA